MSVKLLSMDPSGEQLLLTVIYDNRSARHDLDTAWGFACAVDGLEQRILFDTGADGDTLLANMEKLDINSASFGLIVLSHADWDHVGGIDDLLSIRTDRTVFLTPGFPLDFKTGLRAKGAEVVECDAVCEVCPGARTTGEMGTERPEHGLILDSGNGPVLVTGCAHPGIIAMLQRARQIAEQPVQAALGGFHLKDTDTAGIEEVVTMFREEGVARVGPAHCTGDPAIAAFEKAYGDAFVEVGAGTRIAFERLTD
jgi:7,8-dihydropterin-6-yl-methyl-4-(beta-D-ribofuranosyl)aminobenzene 5'-phosphate synthase